MKKIKGKKLIELEYLLAQFADDTTIILDGSEKCFKATIDTLNRYALFSGLRMNIEKTKVIWIGSKKYSSKFCNSLDMDWTQRPFILLGILFQHNLAEMVERNYKDKLKKLDNLMTMWTRRNLTPIGRITVLKSLILPKLNHLFSSIPNPKTDMINKYSK